MNSLNNTGTHPHGCRTAPALWPAWIWTTVCVAALGLSSATWGAPATGVPANAVNSANHYRESSLGPATGRAGNATLNARALLDKSGNTLVELTTGTLDTSSKPPGNLDKVQYKPFDPNGNAYFAQNFTGLSGGGYYKFSTNGVQHRQQMQLQANVSGIDKRAAVVTVVESVKLRPDITIARLDNPAQGYVNQPVVISAAVRELNGDTGANADCVLSVNDAEVDAASSIWVDAGGVVSCAFAYRFPSAGRHQLKVSANNVVPGDWDAGNNVATGAIDIVNPGSVKLSGWASYYHNDFTRSGTETATVYQNGTLVQNYQHTWDNSGWNEGSYIFGYANVGKPVQFPATVNYQESTDGVVTHSGSGAVSGYNSTWQDGVNACSSSYGYGYTAETSVWSWSAACLDPAGNVLWGHAVVEGHRWAGDVTYLSSGYQCGYWWSGWNQTTTAPDCSTGNYYTWNTSTKSQWGSQVAAGAQHAISLLLTGSDGTTYSANSGAFAIQSYQYAWGPDNGSWSFGPDAWGYSGTYGRDNVVGSDSVSAGSTSF